MYIFRTSVLLKVLFFGTLLAVVLYYAPFAGAMRLNGQWWSLLTDPGDNFLVPVFRSICFAAASTVFIVTVALICSFYLERFSLRQPSSSLLGLLLIPVVMGNLSAAFLWKLLLLHNTIDHYFWKFIVVALIQLWQFGSLFIYLFWLNQQSAPKATSDYLGTLKLGFFERIRDNLIPRQRNLTLLVAFLCFIFCFYEDAKLGFIFKASRGTHTELVTGWLNRTYRSDSLIQPDYAFRKIAQSGLSALVIGILSLGCLVAILYGAYRLIMAYRTRNLPSPSKGNGTALAAILSGSVVLPVLLAFTQQQENFLAPVAHLGYPVLLTILAATLATLLAVGFAVLARLAWPELLRDFNRGSLLFILGLLSLQLVPDLLALLCGFKWMQVVGYASAGNITIAWITAHCFLSFPILSAFAIVMHFSVSNEKIHYLLAHRLTFAEKVKDLFLRPLVIEYILVLILAFATIWNEAVINNILSDSIPSFATELNNAITGKGADYSTGMLYLLVSVLLAVISFILWDQVVRRARKKLNVLS